MSIPIDDIIIKMIDYSAGNLHDIEHFLKVYTYAKAIGGKELKDAGSKEALETAAILHDIACPLCREKYGNTAGHLQELEGGPLCREFLSSFDLPEDFIEKIIWLVSHHHTYTDVSLPEHQILLEADFLVNASESHYSTERILNAKNSFFRTACGIFMLDRIYLRPEDTL